MPDHTKEEFKQRLLKSASPEMQKKYGYVPPSAEETASGSTTSNPLENQSPSKDNFEVMLSAQARNYLKQWDENNSIYKNKLDFSLENTLHSLVKGNYDAGINSEDKEISKSWSDFKDLGNKFIYAINQYEQGLMSQEDFIKESDPKALINSWIDAKNSLDLYYDEKAEEKKFRVGDNKTLYYSPVADGLVDKLTFERNENTIYRGSFYSNVPQYISKTSSAYKDNIPSQYVSGPAGWYLDWAYGKDTDKLSVQNKEEMKLAGYDEAYKLLNNQDPHTEAAYKDLATSYFTNAPYMTADKDARTKYFGDRESAFVEHNQMLHKNVDYLLELAASTDNEKGVRLYKEYKNATKPGIKNGFTNWISKNYDEVQDLASNELTPVQYDRLYKHLTSTAGGSVLSNSNYFRTDNKDNGKKNMTDWVNIIDPYIKNQQILKDKLDKISKRTYEKLGTKNSLESASLIGGTNSNFAHALIIKYKRDSETGRERSLGEIKDLIRAEGERLNELNSTVQQAQQFDQLGQDLRSRYPIETDRMARSNYNYQTAPDFRTRRANIQPTEPGVNMTTEEKKVLSFLYGPTGDNTNITSAGRERTMTGMQWLNSTEFIDEYNRVDREFKTEFGKQAVNEVFQNTLMTNSFGKVGANSIEYRRIDRNNPNAIKTKHLNTVIDLANRSFIEEGMQSLVQVKAGLLENIDKPSDFNNKNVEERKQILKDFFRDDESEYKLAYISKTARENTVAYMISKYNKDGGFDDHITLFMNKDYAKNNKEIFAKNVFNYNSDDIYYIQGSYDLSAYDDPEVGTGLKLVSDGQGGMFLKGSGRGYNAGEKIDYYIGPEDYTTVKEAINTVQMVFKNFKEEKKAINK